MIIRFKEKKNIDFKKIFPIINEEDYTLLAGREMILTSDQVVKLKANKFLNLAGFHIPENLIHITEINIAVEQTLVQKIVDKKFIFAEDIVDILFAGVEAQKNIVLWGRGGHGKSEITELVLEEMYKSGIIKEEPFVQAFGDGLTEEKLFGGMNIQKYKDEGVIEYLPLNSFMNHEIVVFEEIFDAPASVLLSLKDIMTSKKFRQGTEVFNIKTKLIIGLTNKSKVDFAEKDDSLKALAERFPLTLKVEWSHYKKVNFLKLFQVVLGNTVYTENSKKLSELANIIDMNNAQGTTFVSPRTAVSAAQLFLMGKKLEYISEIDPDILVKYTQTQKAEKFNNMYNELLTDIDAYIDNNDLDTMDQSEDFLKELSKMEEEIGEEPLDLSNISTTSTKKKELKINKAKFILSIIDRINVQGNQLKQFNQIKQRLNEIIRLSNAEMDVPEPTEEEVHISL